DAANTFGGDVSVEAGTIRVGSDTALGTTDGDTTVYSGASVVFAAPGLSPDEAFFIDGSGDGAQGALGVDSGGPTLPGSVTLFGRSQIGAADGSTLALDGALGDGGDAYDLTVSNGATGRTVLGGENAWQGDTTVTAGYLRVAGNNALGDANTSSA